MPRDSEEPRQDPTKGEENIDPAAGTGPPPPGADQPTSTLHPPPAHLQTLSLIERYLHLTPLTPTTFTNTNALWHPPGARGIYGGEIIGQAIVAAASTVPPDLSLHSLHAYFVLAGDAKLPITYDVTAVRTGRSFATRQVTALQRGKPVFLLMGSFQRAVPPARKAAGAVAQWQVEMPRVPPPEEVLSEEEKIRRGVVMADEISARISARKLSGAPATADPADAALLERVAAAIRRRKRRLDRDPFEWRKLPPATYPPGAPFSARKVRFWVRARRPLSASIPHAQLAALAYFTDNWFIGTVGRVNPAAGGENLAMMVSLDHAVYFHLGAETRVDDGWLLVEMDAGWVGEERGVVMQRVWRGSDGRLVATCVQEGLVRLREGSVAGERGEREGFAERGEREGVRSKL